MIMDYEQKYKEALNWMRSIYPTMQGTDREDAEHHFPELCESEDEKIRKALIRFFSKGAECDSSTNGIKDRNIIAWIEKQGEKKSADNVEPKFKVGDWVTNGICIIQITSVDDRYYWHDNNCVGGDIESIDKEYHPWTIQDAKDGDVLSDENPFIFRGFRDKNHPSNPTAYCGINVSGTFIVSTGNAWWTSRVPHPATKKEVDLLFQKMHEAGYQWDSDKKELKKIEQKTSWSEEDEKFLNYAISLTDDTQIKNFLKSLKERVQPQPKQEWSVEDNKRLSRIHQFIWANRKGDTDEIHQLKQDADWLMTLKPQSKQEWSEEDEEMKRTIISNIFILKQMYTQSDKQIDYNCMIDWLKSLKPNHWKPSEEQLEALWSVIPHIPNSEKDLDNIKELSALYGKLKNL